MKPCAKCSKKTPETLDKEEMVYSQD